MSEHAKRPSWQLILVSLVATPLAVSAAYYTWVYANMGVRMWDVTKNSLTTDVRFVVGLLAVFVLLSVLDFIIEFVKSKLIGKR